MDPERSGISDEVIVQVITGPDADEERTADPGET